MVADPRTPLRADRLRALNVPEAVHVEPDAAGTPKAVGRSGGRATVAEVDLVLEIWRVDDEWWREEISRRYFEVVLAGGKRVVLFEDLTDRTWFMQQP